MLIEIIELNTTKYRFLFTECMAKITCFFSKFVLKSKIFFRGIKHENPCFISRIKINTFRYQFQVWCQMKYNILSSIWDGYWLLVFLILCNPSNKVANGVRIAHSSWPIHWKRLDLYFGWLCSSIQRSRTVQAILLLSLQFVQAKKNKYFWPKKKS